MKISCSRNPYVFFLMFYHWHNLIIEVELVNCLFFYLFITTVESYGSKSISSFRNEVVAEAREAVGVVKTDWNLCGVKAFSHEGHM